ncbi:ATP-dependent DNA helicase [Alternaria sp. MG1]|nr:ATP-dependent DNA helicase [Alternaria sp. MG1]
MQRPCTSSPYQTLLKSSNTIPRTSSNDRQSLNEITTGHVHISSYRRATRSHSTFTRYPCLGSLRPQFSPNFPLQHSLRPFLVVPKQTMPKIVFLDNLTFALFAHKLLKRCVLEFSRVCSIESLFFESGGRGSGLRR